MSFNTSRRDASGVSGYRYDGAGRLTGITRGAADLACPSGAGERVVCYGYDRAGQLVSLADGRGVSRYRYDAAGRVVELAEASGRRVVFGYDPADRRTDTWYAATGAGFDPARGGLVRPPTGWAAHAKATVDGAGKLTGLRVTTGGSDAGAPLLSQTVGYTPAAGSSCAVSPTRATTRKRRWLRDELTGAVTTFCYDRGGRLVAADTVGGPAPGSYRYAVDANGNVSGGELGAHGVDAANRLTDPGAGFDAAGNQTAGATPAGKFSAAYTGAEQTAAVTVGGRRVRFGDAGADQAERTTAGEVAFTHGRPGRAGLPALISSTAGGTTTHVERDPAGALLGLAVTPTGQPVTAGTPAHYLVPDALGNIALLADPAGSVTARYRYSPYGQTVAATGPAAGLNPYRYKGEHTDTATGLVKMGQRYYNPRDGRWTQHDSLETVGDPARCNRYAAFGADPINNNDPSGLSVGCTIIGSVAGLTMGTAISMAASPVVGAAVGGAITGGLITLCDEATTGGGGIDYGNVAGKALVGGGLGFAGGWVNRLSSAIRTG